MQDQCDSQIRFRYLDICSIFAFSTSHRLKANSLFKHHISILYQPNLWHQARSDHQLLVGILLRWTALAWALATISTCSLQCGKLKFPLVEGQYFHHWNFFCGLVWPPCGFCGIFWVCNARKYQQFWYRLRWVAEFPLRFRGAVGHGVATKIFLFGEILGAGCVARNWHLYCHHLLIYSFLWYSTVNLMFFLQGQFANGCESLIICRNTMQHAFVQGLFMRLLLHFWCRVDVTDFDFRKVCSSFV